MRLILLALCALVACASGDDKYRTTTTAWDDAAPPAAAAAAAAAPAADGAPAAAAAAAPDAPARSKITAKEIADSAIDDRDCLGKATNIYRGSPADGLKVMRACVARPNFLDLNGVLKGPWVGELGFREPLQLMLVELIGRRGGFVEEDVRACRGANVPLYGLDSALENVGMHKGKLVLVRGAVVDVQKAKGRFLATVRESSWEGAETRKTVGFTRSGTAIVQSFNSNKVEDTGRIILVKVERNDPRFSPDRPLVFAVRFEGTRMYDSESEGEIEAAVGTAVAAVDASLTLRM